MNETGKDNSLMTDSEIQEAERNLNSREESVRIIAANALFEDCLARKEYERAEMYLNRLPDQNPDKKKKQAALYEAAEQWDKAGEAYDTLLMSSYQSTVRIINSLLSMSLKQKDLERARYYTDKKKELIDFFEMGEYSAWAAELELQQVLRNRDETITCVKGMLNHLDSARNFTEAPLYSHLQFKAVPAGYEDRLKENLIRAFAKDPDFSYMEEDPRWQAILFGDM